MQNIRLISNGHGEDSIACKLIPFLSQFDVTLDAYPLVGSGRVYQRHSLSPKISQRQLPSGGFLRRPWDIILDIFSGLISNVFKQRRLLKASDAELQIVVGDVFALIMGSWNQSIPTVFLPTAKSERAIPHTKFELFLIRKFSDYVFPRDVETHERMESVGIQSFFYGNPMFDGMKSDLGMIDQPVIALFPGSRDESQANIQQLLDVISQLSLNRAYHFTFALPDSVTEDILKAIIQDSSWSFITYDTHYEFVNSGTFHRVTVSYAFFDTLHRANVVIGLAGTANEQAMFAKRPLISFLGNGSQSTKKRFLEQHQLIDGAQTFLIDSNQSKIIAQEVSTILLDHSFKWQPLPNVQYVARKIVDQVASLFNLKRQS